MTLIPELATEIQKLAPSAMIELFELDATDLGGDLLRFHAGTNELKTNIIWQGNTYQRYPLEIKGFEINGQGQFPRPKLTVSNVMGAITALLLEYDDLMGAKLTRKRTLAKFLDAANFTGGVNPDEDTTAEFPDDVFYIDRKSNEDKNAVEFELASACDLARIKLPRRQVIANVCPWVYRGAECGFTAAPVFNAQDEIIPTAGQSVFAAAVITTYQDMVAKKALLDAAETLLSTKAQAMGLSCDYYRTDNQLSYNTGTGIGNYCVVNYFHPYNGTEITHAYYGGVEVTLSNTYRRGIYYTDDFVRNNEFSNINYTVHYIEKWEVDTVACSAATTAYNTALSDRDTKKTNYDNAVTAHAVAYAALPSDDPVYQVERCGKRLLSCQLRFGETEPLSFGSFPSAGLFR